MKDFLFAQFIDKEFLTLTFKKQFNEVNLVRSLKQVERCLLKATAICHFSKPLVILQVIKPKKFKPWKRRYLPCKRRRRN